MGQKQSSTYITPLTKEVGVEERADTFTLWPGLEAQLEVSFSSLDVEDNGVLPYSTLEPALRHHLMQIGLLEYVTRFALPDGQLDDSQVINYLEEYNLDLQKDLDVVDWKNLMLSWIRRVQDAQHEDIQNWQNSMKAMQEAQTREYQIAMKEFQTHYMSQLEAYYQSIDAVHRQEEEYRKEWENSLTLQEEFYNTQMKYLQERNEEAFQQYNEQVQRKEDLRSEYLNHLHAKSMKGEGNLHITSFAYPTDLTKSGAPISGGAQVPYRRLNRTHQKSVCC